MLIILLVEDDPNDSLLVQRAFKKVGIDLPCHVCTDGADAIAYLKGEGRYSDREKFPFPCVLITDLKMPRCSGFDLLKWLHNHPDCNLIPKIVLSASAEERDVILAYQLGANTYFRKPTTFDELCRTAENAHRYWGDAILPPLPETC